MIKRNKPDQVRSEYQEQYLVCQWLRENKVMFFSVPNGAVLGGDPRLQAAKLKRVGMSNGVPDIIIVDEVPVALEMKSLKGRLADTQKQWLEYMSLKGWRVVVGFGHEDAIKQLKELGYG